MDAITRAQKHIDTLEPAVSGSGGHAATFRACRILVNDYNLSLDEAWPILLSFNARCEPPWNEKELRRKLEDAARRLHRLERVNVVPQPKAGGSFATAVWKRMDSPCAVEEVRARAGLDIGGTLIGMHLRRVAVPVRLSLSKIGEANILCARTRPKLIGGERAKYTEED